MKQKSKHITNITYQDFDNSYYYITYWYNLVNEIKGSTTIENIIYEKHIGEEVSRVGLHPMPVRNGGQFIFGNRK